MTKSFNCTALILFLIFLTVSLANADMTVKKYEEYKSSSDSDVRDVLDVYMRGLTDGISWTNAYLKSINYKEFYCEPSKPPLSTKDYMDILDKAIVQYRKIDNNVDSQYIQPILLRILENTFPCKE